MKNIKIVGYWLIFSLIIVIFCYFRLKPIYFQTVPYTFDQGRDFLKAQEIVKEKNLTLIGPTTGVQGIFHGVWWYYYLAVPYLIFQAHPSGFPLFTFLTFLAVTILFFKFLKDNFNALTALTFLALCAASPYLIGLSFFVISSFPNLPLFLVLFYLTYKILKRPTHIHVFLIFLTLSLILETEVPTGLFLIPAYLLTIFISKNTKSFFNTSKKILFAALGFILPIIPRIISELKNDFLQIKNILNLLKNLGGSEKTIYAVFLERMKLYVDYYYLGLFPDKNIVFPIIFFAVIILGIYFAFKKGGLVKKYYFFTLLLFIFNFLLSLAYKNNFFANYEEGMTLFYVLFLSLSVYVLSRQSNKLVRFVPYGLLGLILFLGIHSFSEDFKSGKPKIDGMKVQVNAVEYIYKNVGKNDFCARVYTPPVIPHTYHYLFDYYSYKRGYKQPDYRFFDRYCWYIIESEPYAFRLEQWRKENIPSIARLSRKQKISEHLTIELWERTNER
jgi:hypothetical protein